MADKKMTRTHLLALFVIIFLSGLILGYLLNTAKLSYFGQDAEALFGHKLQTGILQQSWDLLTQDFLYTEKLDEKQAVYSATAGLVDSLGDPHTIFLQPELSSQFMQSVSNELNGIGAEVVMDSGYLLVVSLLPSSPALRAGLQADDVIYKIDGQPTSEMNIFQAVDKIRGPEGSEVKLTILRAGEKEPLELTVERSKMDIPSVALKQLEGGIVQVTISAFTDKMMQELSDYYPVLKSPETKAIIWDLRDNPGGILDEAIKLNSEFVPVGQPVVWRKYKNFKEALNALPGYQNFINLQKPMVLLVNGGSGSASEIVAGAFKDYGIAPVLGTKTFGKGSMQDVRELPNGASLKLTVAEWLTPKESNINGIGVSPDIEVEQSSEELKSGEDPQIEKALEFIQAKLVDAQKVS